MSGEFLKGIALVDRTTGKPLDLDELETVTKAATGGEWSVEEDFGPGQYSVYSGRNAVFPGDTRDSLGLMRMHSLKLFYLHEPDWNGENTLKYLATFGPNTVLSMIAKLREYEADEKASTEEADRIRRACSASGSEMDRE